jgi:hypothetical protein
MGVLCVDLKSKIAAGHGLTWDPYVTMTFPPHKIAAGHGFTWDPCMTITFFFPKRDLIDP